MQLPTANQGGDYPQVEDGLTLARFDDLILRDHPDWAGPDKFGHDDTGQRYHFCFTLVDEDTRQAVYVEDDPLELEALTRTATGEKSNFAAILKGILTATEFAAWQANEPFDGEKMKGRIVTVEVGHSTKGYPQIKQTLGQPKGKGKAS